MKKINSLMIIMIIMLIGCPPILKGDWYSIGGYYKNFSTVLDFPEHSFPGPDPDPGLMGMVTNRLRLATRFEISEKVDFHCSYNLIPVILDKQLDRTALLDFNPRGYGYRALDLERELYPDDDEESSFKINQNLDRAYLSLSFPKFDLYFGRQAIAWGSAHVINPTDVLAPFPYNELDIENRIGVDALRIRYPLGFMGELDLGYVFGDDFKFENSAFFLRGKTYIERTDISGMVIGFRENLLLGFDLTRYIGGAGFWVEGAYVFSGALSHDGFDEDESYFRGSVGLDYSFRSGTYSFIEYHYNQAGSNDPDDYYSLLNQTAYSEGSVYFLGEHYLAPGFSYQITPLITGYAEAIINLGDPSLLAAPSVEYNIEENIYLSAGGFIGIGEGFREREAIPIVPPVVPQSEFGSYGDIYFVSFKIYY